MNPINSEASLVAPFEASNINPIPGIYTMNNNTQSPACTVGKTTPNNVIPFVSRKERSEQVFAEMKHRIPKAADALYHRIKTGTLTYKECEAIQALARKKGIDLANLAS